MTVNFSPLFALHEHITKKMLFVDYKVHDYKHTCKHNKLLRVYIGRYIYYIWSILLFLQVKFPTTYAYRYVNSMQANAPLLIMERRKQLSSMHVHITGYI